MYQVLFVLLAIMLTSAFLRVRQRKQAKRQAPPIRIQGSVLRAFLAPNIPRQCAQDHGTRFGAGLYLKTSPHAAHPPEQCRCQEYPFFLSSQQVLRGGLHQVVPPWGSQPTLAPKTATWLMQLLQAWACDPTQPQREAWLKTALAASPAPTQPKPAHPPLNWAKTKPRSAKQKHVIDQFLATWQR